METIRVKLKGHEYTYELFQILSLFYDKSEIEFVSNDEYDLESILDSKNMSVEFYIYKDSEEPVKEKFKLEGEDKKQIKNAIKITALRALKRYRSIDIPWGILVGIRPTKIAHECFKEGLNDTEIIDYLVSSYDLSRSKAELTLEVAKNEAGFLTFNQKVLSLYIDVPFCPTRCVYCSFTSNPAAGNQKLIESYIEALLREMKGTLNFINRKGFKIDTLYIGGGTPTSLSASQLQKIFETLGRFMDLTLLREFTVEAGRPDSIDRDKLEIIKKYGCSRISINPQTMINETLKKIGRLHSKDDVIEKFNLARELDFNNINMDVIAGLPSEGIDEIKRTMEEIEKLSPENITIHTMAVKRASVLNEKGYREKNKMVEAMYEIACSSARSLGMYPYYMYRQKNMVSPLENVGYCKNNKECIYNIQMIAENISIAAMGPGAISKLVFHDENRIERVANVKDVREYISRIDEMIDKKIQGLDML